MNPTIADLEFPSKGLELSTGFADQRLDTTGSAVNVMGFEPSTDRLRGGSRPGLSRFIDEQLPLDAQRPGLTYWHLIQHLNIVVYGAVGGLVGDPTDDDGGPGFVDDPSSVGPPGSWGSGPLDFDWNGNPIRGISLGTRNPGPRRTRKGGTGRPPNKNHVSHAPGNNTFTLYQCIAAVLINAPGNIFDGQSPSFDGCACVGTIYLALAGAPTSSLQFAQWHSNRAAFFLLHDIPDGAWSFVTASNLITGPVRTCTVSDLATCSQVTGGASGTYPPGG